MLSLVKELIMYFASKFVISNLSLMYKYKIISMNRKWIDWEEILYMQQKRPGDDWAIRSAKILMSSLARLDTGRPAVLVVESTTTTSSGPQIHACSTAAKLHWTVLRFDRFARDLHFVLPHTLPILIHIVCATFYASFDTHCTCITLSRF